MAGSIDAAVAGSRVGLTRAVGGAVRARVGRNVAVVAGVTIVAAIALAALLASVIAPVGPTHQDLQQVLLPPGTDGHLLGTDHLGRDVLARLLHAARTDLLVAAGAVGISLLAGTAVGAIAGYFGGIVDSVLMRTVDVVFAFPVLVLLIALVAVLGPGIGSTLIAVAIVDWVAYARLVRAGVRGEREKEYVMAAQVGGLSHLRVLLRHVLPNIAGQSVIYAMADAVLVILAITTLGFLGLGVPPPSPDWGGMIFDAQPYVDQWWLTVCPGAMILLTGLGLSLIADGLATQAEERA